MTISKHNLVTKTRLNSLVKEFGADNLKTDGKILLCIFCHIPVNPKKASYITQHFASQKHIKAVENNSILPLHLIRHQLSYKKPIFPYKNNSHPIYANLGYAVISHYINWNLLNFDSSSKSINHTPSQVGQQSQTNI